MPPQVAGLLDVMGQWLYKPCVIIIAGHMERDVLNVSVDPGEATCIDINTDGASMHIAEDAYLILSQDQCPRADRNIQACTTMRNMSCTPPAVSAGLLQLFFCMLSICSTAHLLSFGFDAPII